jgi:hypothetical protein
MYFRQHPRSSAEKSRVASDQAKKNSAFESLIESSLHWASSRGACAMKRRTEMNGNLNTPNLTIHESSDYVRLAKRNLNNMCWMVTGPMFRKHGAMIFDYIDELWTYPEKVEGLAKV